MSGKTLRELEVERGFLVRAATEKQLDAPISDEDTQELVMSGKAVGVDHAARIKFLQDNGYAVNRKNMIDPSLSAKT